MGILGRQTKAAEPAPPAGGLSIIAVGMTISGDIDAQGTVKVEGAVDGHVRSRSQVLVAKGGVVHGDIEGREAVVGGSVHGAIRTTERVEIQAGAVVNGDIATRRISVAEGGTINGQIRMNEQALAQQKATPRPENKPGLPVASTVVTRPSVPVGRVAVPPRLPTAGQGRP
jgi:cytoskeletal protein CcmA (bactofilin family)